LGWQRAGHPRKVILAGAAVKAPVFMPLPALTHRQAFQFINDCWMFLFAVWVLAMFSAKRSQERWSPLTHLGYTFSWVVTFALLFRFPGLDAPRLVDPGPVPSGMAVGLSAAGLVIAIWARMILGRNWSGSITFKRDHELIEQGPYRLVRHPIYTGLLLMVAATAIARGTLWAFLGLVLFLVIHLWKLRREEELLTRHFPDSYPAYRTRTKALIPFLY